MNSKKIGILTYHDTTNYGAVLQAYALQKIIEQKGYNCEIINYKCPAIVERYKIIKIFKTKNIKQFVKALLFNNSKKKLKNKFDSFNLKFQKISRENFTKTNINKANYIYDKFIVGSDQVWNLSLSGEDTTYLLDFVNDNSKKCSYAASFGYNQVPDKYVNILKNNLLEFDENNILVREEQGIEITKKLINKKANLVLDPTLLLSKEDWNNLLNLDKNIKVPKRYILLYVVAPNKKIFSFAKKIAKKEKCKIIFINNTNRNEYGMKNIRDVGPIEFLKYIKYANYVITTSFHGLAFSINFEKQFYYALSNNKDNYNSRLENLVKLLDLSNRNFNSFNEESENINYNIINKKINDYRKESIKLLEKEMESKNDKKQKRL